MVPFHFFVVPVFITIGFVVEVKFQARTIVFDQFGNCFFVGVPIFCTIGGEEHFLALNFLHQFVESRFFTAMVGQFPGVNLTYPDY